MPRPRFDLYLITDPALPLGLVGSVEAALREVVPSGRVAVQLRAKQLSAPELLEAGRKLRVLTERAGVALLVNGFWQVANAIGADGVQIPDGDCDMSEIRSQLGPQALLGRSCHDLAGVLASLATADFVTLSPYSAVPEEAPPLPSEMARKICHATSLPVFALGGITTKRAATALASGAHGIAVIRAVLGSVDPAQSLHQLLAELDVAKQVPSAEHGKSSG